MICPDNAKIGTFVIGTPVLSGPLEGSVYIGEPKARRTVPPLSRSPQGFGMDIKLIGSFKPNPETGQLTVYFENLPQAPFAEFAMHLFSGERALMATPTACTIYTTKAVFYPWDTALPYQESNQIFGLDPGPHGCRMSRPDPSLQPEPGSRHQQPHRRRLLGLHP